MAKLTKIFCRLIIVLGFAAAGLLLGMLWAAKSGAADGSGLAGGAIVLGYGVIGAFFAAVLGLFVGLRLSGPVLSRTAGILGIALLIIITLVAWRIRSERLARLDPPSAYEGLPSFELKLQRTDRADPVLARSIAVDGDKRLWISELPDERICSSQASASALQKAAGALQKFLTSTDGKVDCNDVAESVLTWRIETDEGQRLGSISFNTTCLASEPEAQFVVFALQQVTLASNAPVKCR